MKKLILLLVFIITFTFISGCDKKENAYIYFSSGPINKDSFSVSKAQTDFMAGQRINFVIFTPEPFNTNKIRLQFLKIDQKSSPLNIFTVAQVRDIQVDPDKNYVVNNVYLYLEGYYILRVFKKSDWKKPFAQADFKVNPL